MIALAVTVATAVASPCDEAEKGTYLSNVCWLLDDYSRDAFPSHRVASVDPDNCTVTTTRNEVINFMKSDGNVQIILDGTAMCWKLFGKGIHIYPDISKDGGVLLYVPWFLDPAEPLFASPMRLESVAFGHIHNLGAPNR